MTITELKRMPFADLTRKVSGFLDTIKRTDPSTGRIANARTYNRKRNTLSSFFAYLGRVHDHSRNPITLFPIVKLTKKSTTASLTENEVKRFLDHLKGKTTETKTGHRDYLVVVCLVLLALRRHEAGSLRWDGIDWHTRSISVIQKGGTEKMLPLPHDLLKLLKSYHKQQNGTYVFQSTRTSKTKPDRPISTSLIYRLIRDTGEELFPGRGITPHSLRKSFIEQALDQKIDLVSIMNATGHKSLEMIQYYDTRDVLSRNAVHGMARLLK